MRDYERQLIDGLSKEEADGIINSINAINRLIGLKEFDSE